MSAFVPGTNGARWRFEEEFRYQQNGITGATIGPLSFPSRGNRTAYALMTNVLYDFTFGWPFSPHIGAGIGAVELHDSWNAPVVGTIANSSDLEFGYQGIAGVRYNINPSLAFDVDYRYLATTDPTFSVARVKGVRYTSGYSTHSVLASLSVRFGAPPPPVATSPAPPAPPPIAAQGVPRVLRLGQGHDHA